MMFERDESLCGRRGGGRPGSGPEGFLRHWRERAMRQGRFGGPGRFGGGGGRGEGRLFASGDLRLMLLHLIAEAPRHGYDLIRAIEEMTGGAYAPSPGVVYPTLTLLTEMGLLREQAAEGARKLFEITEEGRAHLLAQAPMVQAALARIGAAGDRLGRASVAPLRRAMHNLRIVLMHRLAGGMDAAQAQQAVDLIDEAARRIEKL